MRKYILLLSLSLNALLAVAVALLSQSNTLNFESLRLVDQNHLADIAILEGFLAGKLSKQEATAILEREFNSQNYFDKSAENGIGAGHMFLVFDDKGLLTKIEVRSFEGP